MTDWMEYLYMQQAKPTDAVGVPVVLSVVDANGNYREIGTTTTSEGFFSFSWKPDIEGTIHCLRFICRLMNLTGHHMQ